jgi:hypothetical protein
MRAAVTFSCERSPLKLRSRQAVGALDLTRIGGLDHLEYIAFGYNTKYYQVNLSRFNIQFKLS